MEHLEFINKDHVENEYRRKWAKGKLSNYIDFCWETNFDFLLEQYPEGFSDALFPNIGYTYLINLGTPFVMQLNDKSFDMKTDGFLPRHNSIECYHQRGNQLFGIKFRISPVIFEKRINFSEYREYIFPLAYLLDREVIEKVKNAPDFAGRVGILSTHFQAIVDKYSGSLQPVKIVREILDHCFRTNDFTTPVEVYASRYNISSRTLQRYFETSTSISSKKALQIMRIRKAVAHMASSPESFHYSIYGYYDHSHFSTHRRQHVAK